MTFTSSPENDKISLTDATCIVRDGLDLLDIVIATNDSGIDQGSLQVMTDSGNFNVTVNLDDNHNKQLADENGGVWYDHPTYGAEDWRIEVENHDTRAGYWEWVASKIEQEEAEIEESEL